MKRKRFNISREICFGFLVGVFLFFITESFSQVSRANNWRFGSNIGLNFTAGSPTLVTGGALTNSLGCAAISDLSGNLLFYTDGVTIYNSTNAIMANGTGLDGVDASQSSIIVKQPSSQNVYYIFTVGGWNTGNGLKYSIVDMSLAAGMGSVTTKNVLLDVNCHDKLTVGKHCNGNDIWIVSTRSISPFFVSCLLTTTGVSTVAVSGGNTNQNILGLGQLKMSPNSRKLAIVTQSYVPNSYLNVVIALFDFDNSSGTINNSSQVLLFSSSNQSLGNIKTYGCEFSPNSMQLYYTLGPSNTNSFLLRYDLCTTLSGTNAGTVYDSETTSQDTASKKSMQLAPDGKIYIAKNGKASLGAIINPNNYIPLATFQPTALSLNTFTCQWGLPNFPGFYFEQKPFPFFSYTVNASNCQNTQFNTPGICSSSGYSVNSYQWNFGEPASGSNNISSLQNPSHLYAQSGTYTVSLIRTFLCNTNDTITQIVNITQPVLSTASSTNCFGTTATVQATGGAGPYAYLWSANSQTNSTASFTTSGVYTVNVQDQGAGNCLRTATIAVTVPTINVTTIISPSVICFGANNAQVTVNVTGGSGSYMYSYAQITQSASVLNNLFAGIYTVTVSDFGFSCVLSKTIAITSAPPIVILSAATPSQVCDGSSVTVVAYASGGSGVFSYLWQPNAVQSNTLLLTPAPGSYVYTVSASDGMACSATETLSFVVNPKPLITLANTNACLGTQASITAFGANSYTWQPINFVGTTYTTLANANTIFTVTGSSTANCLNTNTVSLSAIPAVTVNASVSSPICEGQSANFNAGSVASYVWQGPGGFISNAQNPQINNVQLNNGGVYTLTTTDANGCKSKTQTILVVNNLPQINLAVFTNSICLGKSVNISASGASTYTWTNGSNANSLQMSPNTNTVYTVTGTDALTGCVATASLMVYVKNCNLTGLVDHTFENNQIQIFPNPNHGEFLIQMQTDARFVVVNEIGERIKEGDLRAGENKIKLTGVSTGIYFIKISNQNLNFTTKIVVE